MPILVERQHRTGASAVVAGGGGSVARRLERVLRAGGLLLACSISASSTKVRSLLCSTISETPFSPSASSDRFTSASSDAPAAGESLEIDSRMPNSDRATYGMYLQFRRSVPRAVRVGPAAPQPPRTL